MISNTGMFSDQGPDNDKECLHKMFPLNDAVIKRVQVPREVTSPLYSDKYVRVNSNCFELKVPGTGAFFACDGNMAEYSIEPGADPEWVRLYLKGQVLVALLHQRKIINFHASSFVYNGRGVMILGETGAGKSSLTASFALEGAGFLTDDITPVVYSDGDPLIWSLHEVIRIRRSTALQLNIDASVLREAEAGTGKQYMKVKHAGVSQFPLDVIIKIEVGDTDVPLFDQPLPADRFSFLRSEICLSDLLAGMPGTERSYLLQLLLIVEKVHFVRVVRPSEIRIKELHRLVSEYLHKSLDRRRSR